ncbi:FimB/Mfa2 family fimbrial subunit, partial [Elizabethkingia anophelis]
MKYFLYTYFSVYLFLIVGCSKETFHEDPIEDITSGAIRLSANITTGNTVGATMGNESKINDLTLLLFDQNDQYVHYPFSVDYSRASDNTVEIQLPGGIYKSIVVLANAKELIAEKESGFFRKVPKADILRQLVFRKDLNDKWDLNTGLGIPMWGELQDVNINEASSKKTYKINFLRMLAGIEVVLDQNLKDVTLDSVNLHNNYNSGTVVPVVTSLTEDHLQVTSVSIPAGAQKAQNPSEQYLTYRMLNAPAGSIRGIYLFESDKTDNKTEKTCLTVGLKVKGILQYYRVELNDALLRNHAYRVKINRVNRRGADTVPDAFNGDSSIRLTTTIEEHQIGENIDLNINGKDQYLIY